MDCIEDVDLLKKDGTVSGSEVIKNKKIVALFFGASWCPSCRDFTPKLSAMYRQLQEENASFEIVYVSADQNEAQFKKYQKDQIDWLAIPYGHVAAKSLRSRFDIKGIPILIVFKAGKVITLDGRTDVNSKGKDAYNDWLKM